MELECGDGLRRKPPPLGDDDTSQIALFRPHFFDCIFCPFMSILPFLSIVASVYIYMCKPVFITLMIP